MTGHPDNWTGWQRWSAAVLCSLVMRPAPPTAIPPAILDRLRGKGLVCDETCKTWPHDAIVVPTPQGYESAARLTRDTACVLSRDGLALRAEYGANRIDAVDLDGDLRIIAKHLPSAYAVTPAGWSAALARGMG